MKVTVSIRPKVDEDIKFPDYEIIVEDGNAEAATKAVEEVFKATQCPLILVSRNTRSDAVEALAKATKGTVVAK